MLAYRAAVSSFSASGSSYSFCFTFVLGTCRFHTICYFHCSVGTTLLGVGKVVYNKGGLELRKPTVADSSYILTNMTKEELVEKMKSKAQVFKIVAGVFGIAGEFATLLF